jgi:hypothetical protein
MSDFILNVSDVTQYNVFQLMLRSNPKPISGKDRDFYLVGEGDAYIGYLDNVGFILDADGAIAVFDRYDDECRFTWFMTRGIDNV